MHASDACGSRERPTGRALPQAQHRSTPQQIRKDADVAPCCSRTPRIRCETSLEVIQRMPAAAVAEAGEDFDEGVVEDLLRYLGEVE